MSIDMSSLKRPAPRWCIFCQERNANSKEHFYSEWTHDLLPLLDSPQYDERMTTNHPIKGKLEDKIRRKPGDIYTKKVRVVCTDCNNGWMNVIEGKARPFLEPLINGDTVRLTEDAAFHVARWIALKVMVAEHNDRALYIVPPGERRHFMDTGEIPFYFRIYAARHSSEARSGFIRQSMTMSQTKAGPQPPLEGRQRNTAQTSFILGSLFIHVNVIRLDGITLEDRLMIPRLYDNCRLWHWPGGERDFPSTTSFTSDEMNQIAYSVDALAPTVRWGGDLPENGWGRA